MQPGLGWRRPRVTGQDETREAPSSGVTPTRRPPADTSLGRAEPLAPLASLTLQDQGAKMPGKGSSWRGRSRSSPGHGWVRTAPSAAQF